MIGGGAQRDGHPVGDLSVDLTSLLDVLFMVLVFFLLTANSVPIALQLELPRDVEGSAQPLEDDKPIRLEIHADAPFWRVDDEPLGDWGAARERLRALHAENPDRAIAIAGERHASLEHMVNALGFLESEHIAMAQLMLDPGGADGPSTNQTGVNP
jgi:biopolymer transport protein ExbD